MHACKGDCIMRNPRIGCVGLGGQSAFLSVDHFHRTGETLHARHLFCEPGGKAYNQAVAARRLGADVLFFGCVGDDPDGAVCEQVLLKEGITPVLHKATGVPTAYACILTDRNGENQVTAYRGAADLLTARFLYDHAEQLGTCDMLLLGMECPIEATAAAFAIAERKQIPVVFNPAPAEQVPQEFIRQSFVITPNEQEAKELFGVSPLEEPRHFDDLAAHMGISNLIVTLGGKGALLITAGERHMIQGISVNAVDTTGAGDTFNAALAVWLAKESSLRKAAQYAILASAYSVQYEHVLSGLPSLGQLQAWSGMREIQTE